MDFVRLSKQIENGDIKAMSVLYDYYSPALYGLIIRTLKSEGQPEEVLQQTFMYIWQNIGSYNKQQGSMLTWLTCITRRLINEYTKTIVLPAIILSIQKQQIA